MTNSPSSCALQTMQTIPIDAPLATARWMTARVYSLMFHLWRDDMPVEVRAMVIADWRAVLGDLPKSAIERAILERLCENNPRKITAGEIRQRAKRFLQPPPTIADNATFPPVIVDADELERRRDDRFQTEMRRIYPKLKRMTKAEGD